MKLHCPHCGVKGSADDSYSGRQVKCPKCHGLFVLEPDVAFDLSEDPSPLSTPSTSTESLVSADEAPFDEDEDSGEAGLNISSFVTTAKETAELMKDLSGPEPEETAETTEQQEALDWEDVASEIDLQQVESETGESPEELMEGGPADLSDSPGDFEASDGDPEVAVESDRIPDEMFSDDIWAEDEDVAQEVQNLHEESAIIDSAELESSEQEIESDLPEVDEIAENDEQEGAGENDRSEQESDEIELEPSGIEKEQCWQCGKAGSVDDPFVEKDGRKYCAACLSIEDSEEIVDTGTDHDTEDAQAAEAAGLHEESSMFDPVHFIDPESSEKEFEGDLAVAEEMAESDEKEGVADDGRLEQEFDEIELEPYGIEEEQCWQCGKESSVDDPFIAQDGRLYCADCISIEDPAATADTDLDHDQEESLYAAGLKDENIDLADDATAEPSEKLSIGDAIRKAWEMTKGAKGTIWAGSAVMYLVILVLIAGGAYLLPSPESELTNMTEVVGSMLFQFVTNVFSVLFTAGLLLMGIKKVAGHQISWKMVFEGFSSAGKIIVATILQSILVTIGFLLLILPGIYLTIGYTMTLPLILDKGLSPWQAMETSRKAIHKIWWKMAGLLIVMGLIFLVSLVPLGIGLIWTWPMFIVLAGVVYRYLFGSEKAVD
ncbi:MAG: hypothetical protein WBB19_16550 [Desulforhopalus sp.]